MLVFIISETTALIIIVVLWKENGHERQIDVNLQFLSPYLRKEKKIELVK